MKRIKQVFKNYSECAHVWASQTQATGRAHGRRMFFEGPSIWSYGYHFEIARFVKPGKRSPAVVLFTDRDYSPTTAKHKWAVRGAVSHEPVFTVPTFDNHAANAAGYLSDIEAAIASLKRSYGLGYENRRLTNIQNIIKEANAYLRWFGKTVKAETRRALNKHFRNVDRILTAGCHNIPVSELHRVAADLGWTNGVPLTAEEVTGEAMPRTAADGLPGDGFGAQP